MRSDEEMQMSKEVSIYVSDEEVVKKATSIELMRIIRNGLEKIRKDYTSTHNIHCQYLKEMEEGKRHSSDEVVKYQEDFIRTSLNALAELEGTIKSFNTTLKFFEDYHKVRGFKGKFP